MATKTISIDMVAYNKLSAARLGPRDSFSQVIRRAHWNHEPKTCLALLSSLSEMPVADAEVVGYWDSAQKQDVEPDDSWA